MDISMYVERRLYVDDLSARKHVPQNTNIIFIIIDFYNENYKNLKVDMLYIRLFRIVQIINIKTLRVLQIFKVLIGLVYSPSLKSQRKPVHECITSCILPLDRQLTAVLVSVGMQLRLPWLHGVNSVSTLLY